MPANLIVIVFIQAVIFGIFYAFANKNKIEKTRWFSVAVTGLLFGLTMDLVLGNFGLFVYLPDGVNGPAVEPQKLPFFLLIVNAITSYGLAVATAAIFSNSITGKMKRSLFWLIICGLFISIGILGIILSSQASIIMMFSWGILIVSIGEMLLLFYNKGGPIITLFSSKSYMPFLKLWSFSIIIGFGYEVANSLFPFWVWLPGADVSALKLEILIICLGYFALFHFMLTLCALFGYKK